MPMIEDEEKPSSIVSGMSEQFLNQDLGFLRLGKEIHNLHAENLSGQIVTSFGIEA